MKVVLSLISLTLVAVCNADPYLKCTESECAILWPDYDNLSQYYECQGIGLPVIRTCDANTVFTFVYQSCTPQAQYIPAPPLENLPTDTPTDVTATTPSSTSTSSTLPTPQTASPESTDSTATPSTATPSTATSSTATPSTTTPSTEEPATTTTTSTTSDVPGPPSPAASDAPLPATPAPTPPTAVVTPPSVAATVAGSR